MKKIFCAAYGGGHIAIVDLVARRLVRQPGVTLRLLALTAAHGQVVDAYAPGIVRRMSDYLPLFDDTLDDVLRYGRELAGAHHNAALNIPRIESLAYLGLSYADLVARHGAEEAGARYRQFGRQAFTPVATMRRILEFERPDLVLTTSTPRCEQALLIAARELGIPDVQVLDLCGEMYPLPEGRNIVTPDQDTIDSLTRQGVTGRTFHPFGQPVLEQTAADVAGIDPAPLKERLGLGPDERVLLVATARPIVAREDISVERFLTYDEVCEPLFASLETVARETGCRILLRRHPNEDPADYQPWLSRHPRILPANGCLSFLESLAIADAVLVQHSTVGSQAAVCGRTVITYNHSRQNPYPSRRYERPPYRHAPDVSELTETLVKALRTVTSSPRPDIAGFRATDRIVELVMSLLGQSPSLQETVIERDRSRSAA